MTDGRTCINCGNLDKSHAEDPKCLAACVDFPKQLISGETIDCSKWRETQEGS